MVPRRAPLEMFKFSVYILLPIATIAYVSQPDAIDQLIRAREYIVYPPEGKRPPRGTKEEISEALERLKAEKAVEAAPPTQPAVPVSGVTDFAKPNPGATSLATADPSGSSSGWLSWIWGK